jgi:hypothetical protein
MRRVFETPPTICFHRRGYFKHREGMPIYNFTLGNFMGCFRRDWIRMDIVCFKRDIAYQFYYGFIVISPLKILFTNSVGRKPYD